MWHGVPFACQRRPIVGVLRMCWLLPGSFDCFCCPHTSVHRPSIACLAVFLCGPGALFLHALSGPSTICPFPPHGWSAPDGLPLLLRKQPIWAAGDTPHLMPVEQGLPWHPVATGLAGQAIPFIVAASHAHALPSAPLWFSVPAVPVASPALLCPSSLSAVPALVPPPRALSCEFPHHWWQRSRRDEGSEHGDQWDFHPKELQQPPQTDGCAIESCLRFHNLLQRLEGCGGEARHAQSYQWRWPSMLHNCHWGRCGTVGSPNTHPNLRTNMKHRKGVDLTKM